MQNAVNCAIKTLIDNDICKIPLSNDTIERVIKNQGYKIVAYNIPLSGEDYKDFESLNLVHTAENYKAFTYVKGNNKYVFYRSTLTSEKKMRIFAHELGHIMLNHLSAPGVRCSTEFQDENNQEREAEEFALEFLAPTCILKAMRVVKPDEISRFTSLDEMSAKNVYFKVHNHKRNTSEEKELLENFKTKRLYNILLPIFLIVGIIVAIVITYCVIDDNKNDNSNQNQNIIVTPTEHALFTPYFESEQRIEQTPYVDMQNENKGVESQYKANDDIEGDNKGDKNEVVVVTKTGDKYHLPDCQHVRGKTDLTELTKQEAIDKGYEACKVCKP